jgi:NADPH2:quinone reductase
MKAVLLEGTGGPENLVLRDVPDPEPAEGQVVVDVRAAGINFADVLVRTGNYPQMPELPAVLGAEIAGEAEGRRVMGFTRTRGGGYAARAAVERRWLFPLPERASFAEGAAFPMAFLTAWIPLTQLVRIGFGSRVLVTAAAGAVGTAAIQLVKTLNGRPVAAVGSEEKLELTRSLGADEGVTYESLGSSRSTSCSTSSAETSSRRRSACSSRWAPQSRPGTRAGCGKTSARPGSWAATSASRASTSAA